MSQVVFVMLMLNWWQGSWNDWGPERRLLSTWLAITSLILGVQGWNFDTIWAPVMVTSGMNFSWLLPLLWELACFLCFVRVLKGVSEYNFCNNFINIRSTRLKFWYNMGTYGMDFSILLPLLSELLPFLCVFGNAPKLLLSGHNGPAGAQ